jgi:hypothetical protein
MTHFLAYLSGVISMGVLWFLSDIKDNRYSRGYYDGFMEAIDEMKEELIKQLEKGGEENETD